MTARTMKGDREKCLEAGMSDYLSKPFQISELREVIRRWGGARHTLSSQAEIPAIDEGKVVFDRQAFVEMLMGDEELARKTLAMFLDSIPERIATLKEALARGETHQVHLLGHSIKGVAASISAHALASVAQKVETAAMEEDLARVSSLMPLLVERFSLVAEAIMEGPRDGDLVHDESPSKQAAHE